MGAVDRHECTGRVDLPKEQPSRWKTSLLIPSAPLVPSGVAVRDDRLTVLFNAGNEFAYL